MSSIQLTKIEKTSVPIPTKKGAPTWAERPEEKMVKHQDMDIPSKSTATCRHQDWVQSPSQKFFGGSLYPPTPAYSQSLGGEAPGTPQGEAGGQA